MKKLFNPGFEFAFALGILATFMLPPLALAQQHKELTVKITNTDTIINGKNLKELSGKDRDEALKQLQDAHLDDLKAADGKRHLMMRYKKDGGDSSKDIIIEKGDRPGDMMARVPGMEHPFMFKFDTDSLDKMGEMHLKRMFKDDMPQAFNFDFAPGDMPRTFNHLNMMMGHAAKNSQSFNYSNIDKDGISTRISFNISDAGPESIKRIAGVEKAELEINDLTLVPMFSSGKTLLSFSLEGNAAAQVELKNTEGKVLLSGKTSGGTFTKTFDLPQNGVYYLQVKQGNKTGLKRIVKQQ